MALLEVLRERRHGTWRRQRPAVGIFEARRKIGAQGVKIQPVGRRLRRLDREGRARVSRQRRAGALLGREGAGFDQRGAMGDKAKMSFAVQRRNPHPVGSGAQKILQKRIVAGAVARRLIDRRDKGCADGRRGFQTAERLDAVKTAFRHIEAEIAALITREIEKLGLARRKRRDAGGRRNGGDFRRRLGFRPGDDDPPIMVGSRNRRGERAACPGDDLVREGERDRLPVDLGRRDDAAKGRAQRDRQGALRRRRRRRGRCSRLGIWLGIRLGGRFGICRRFRRGLVGGLIPGFAHRFTHRLIQRLISRFWRLFHRRRSLGRDRRRRRSVRRQRFGFLIKHERRRGEIGRQFSRARPEREGWPGIGENLVIGALVDILQAEVDRRAARRWRNLRREARLAEGHVDDAGRVANWIELQHVEARLDVPLPRNRAVGARRIASKQWFKRRDERRDPRR